MSEQKANGLTASELACLSAETKDHRDIEAMFLGMMLASASVAERASVMPAWLFRGRDLQPLFQGLVQAAKEGKPPHEVQAVREWFMRRGVQLTGKYTPVAMVTAKVRAVGKKRRQEYVAGLVQDAAKLMSPADFQVFVKLKMADLDRPGGSSGNDSRESVGGREGKQQRVGGADGSQGQGGVRSGAEGDVGGGRAPGRPDGRATVPRADVPQPAVQNGVPASA